MTRNQPPGVANVVGLGVGVGDGIAPGQEKKLSLLLCPPKL